jgi:hypothetical protein
MVTVVYLIVAISSFVEQRPGLAIVYFGYAFANLGLIYEASK